MRRELRNGQREFLRNFLLEVKELPRMQSCVVWRLFFSLENDLNFQFLYQMTHKKGDILVSEDKERADKVPG